MTTADTGFQLEMIRGDTPEWQITVYKADGSRYDISTCLLWLTAKRKKTDADADAVFQLTLVNGGIVITDGPNGEAVASPAPSDTNSLTQEVSLYYDIQVRDPIVPRPKTFTLRRGQLSISLDITRA